MRLLALPLLLPGFAPRAAAAEPCVTDTDGLHDFLYCPEPATWAEAQAACAADGYHLADVDDATENAWLYAGAVALDASQGWWTGFNDRAREGTFVWDGGSSSTFTAWRTGEPNDYGGAEDCARWTLGGGGEWADAPCDTLQPYVCEAGCLYESAFEDADGDGWGDPATETRQCGAPAGTIPDGGDCDDGDGAVHPRAGEACTPDGDDPVDEDCDGLLDAADPDLDPATGVYAFPDADGDGYGAGEPVLRCALEPGEVAVGGDCDDADPALHPDAVDHAGDGIDQDCDGADSCTYARDADGDGWGDPAATVVDCSGRPDGAADNALDCDDSDATIHPEAAEVWYDGVDQDCAGDDDDDQDHDGLRAVGHGGDDCDDTDPLAFPGAPERCDGTDDDCDGLVDEPNVDDDGVAVEVCDGCVARTDGERAWLFCVEQLPWEDALGACAARGYGFADALDADEDAFLYAEMFAAEPRIGAWLGLSDRAEEGAFAWESGAAVGYTHWRPGEPNAYTEAEDCARYADPGSAGEPGEWNDADCSAARPYICELGCVEVTTWADADGDGFGDDATASAACDAAPGRVLVAGDCDDGDGDVSPAASEVCTPDGGAPTDEDCDGLVDDADPSVAPGSRTPWYPDADGDGYGVVTDPVDRCAMPPGYAPLAGDCDDADPATHPGALEVLDGLDNDCNGLDETGDSDGDGLSDLLELALGCDPTSQDGDGDGILDASEAGLDHGVIPDADGDGVPDCMDPDPAPGCGCASRTAPGGSAGFGWLAAALAAVASRRRQGERR